jgi:hypothetical protein
MSMDAVSANLDDWLEWIKHGQSTKGLGARFDWLDWIKHSKSTKRLGAWFLDNLPGNVSYIKVMAKILSGFHRLHSSSSNIVSVAVVGIANGHSLINLSLDLLIRVWRIIQTRDGHTQKKLWSMIKVHSTSYDSFFGHMRIYPEYVASSLKIQIRWRHMCISWAWQAFGPQISG